MLTRYELESELEQELARAPLVRFRYVRGPHGEFESEPGWEGFDPRPPAPGTTLLTHFAFAGATVSRSHRALIARVAASAVSRMTGPQTFPPTCIFIEVEGHEDEVGDPARFRRIGAARAAAVARILGPTLTPLILRVPAANRRPVIVTVSSAGPVRPIRSNVTPEGRAFNRRVEMRVRVNQCPGTFV